MLEWVKALSPIIVAVIPIVYAVVKTARETRMATAKEIAKARNEIGEVREALGRHVTADEWNEQKQRRVRILRFAYDVRRGLDYSEDYWNDIIEDCDQYKAYCDSHPEYLNSKGELVMEYLKDEYKNKLKGENR